MYFTKDVLFDRPVTWVPYMINDDHTQSLATDWKQLNQLVITKTITQDHRQRQLKYLHYTDLPNDADI